MAGWMIQCVLMSVVLVLAEGREFKTVEDYMNVCINGINHKESPGKESGLVSELCSPWASRSCCTPEISRGLQSDTTWLNFDWDHCRTLSPRCREHFLMDLCFYECSPNVGPWVIEDVRKIRSERFAHVPLCQQSCTNWWEACKDDFTCIDNWAVKFDWSQGINKCPAGAQCKPFHQVYSGANHFCETLFNNSFTVVPDDQHCFLPWFDPAQGNPNEAVARRKASQILNVPYTVTGGGGDSGVTPVRYNSLLLSLTLLLLGLRLV